jgi:putative ABC transport system permease protein
MVNIINESAIEAFGWSSPEEALSKGIGRSNEPIIGICKDFHFEGLQNAIGPLVIFVWPDHFEYVTLTVNTENLGETMTFLHNKYQELFPGTVADFFFLNDDFELQYRAEEQVSKIFNIFTFLGIFIACLGLFGLSAFIAEQRTKEIGIRKVLGATVTNIVHLMSREFILLVGIANLIAFPIAYYLMSRWLENFAYRTAISWETFIFASVIALSIAIITVSIQALKAAIANPVDSLRYE